MFFSPGNKHDSNITVSQFMQHPSCEHKWLQILCITRQTNSSDGCWRHSSGGRTALKINNFDLIDLLSSCSIFLHRIKKTKVFKKGNNIFPFRTPVGGEVQEEKPPWREHRLSVSWLCERSLHRGSIWFLENMWWGKNTHTQPTSPIWAAAILEWQGRAGRWRWSEEAAPHRRNSPSGGRRGDGWPARSRPSPAPSASAAGSCSSRRCNVWGNRRFWWRIREKMWNTCVSSR